MPATVNRNKKIPVVIWFDWIAILLILGYLLVNQTIMAPHSIRVQDFRNQQWAAWEMAYSLKQISERYPELLPWVHPLHSRIKEVREAAQGKYEDAYYDMHWLDEDGMHIFPTLYKKRRLQNYWQMDYFVLPSPYLKSDKSHILKHAFGKGIKEGTYFIAPTDDYERYGEGYFIEILHNGWKLGNIDLHDYEIVLQKDDNETITLYKDIQFISPLLPFGKYILKSKEGFSMLNIEVS